VPDLTNFDDRRHRVESATAAFQKGIYHLFVLQKRSDPDKYGQIVRVYQCLFQICLSQLLLDARFSLNRDTSRLPKRLRQLCRDPGQPTRADLDPACIVTHSVFENRKWNGFPEEHPMCLASRHALSVYGQVVDVRHNLLYRPQMLDAYWEDCTLNALIGGVPSFAEIEVVYREFVNSLWEWRQVEHGSRAAEYFIQTIFIPYVDRTGARPRETLLLSYARLLNPDDHQFICELREFRNELLGLQTEGRYSEITILAEWRAGEL
jgi:hypothetical protein